eukprot:gene15624-biopygen11807
MYAREPSHDSPLPMKSDECSPLRSPIPTLLDVDPSYHLLECICDRSRHPFPPACACRRSLPTDHPDATARLWGSLPTDVVLEGLANVRSSAMFGARPKVGMGLLSGEHSSDFIGDGLSWEGSRAYIFRGAELDI